MARRTGTRKWGFAATCAGSMNPLQFLFTMVRMMTGREVHGIMSFVNVRNSHISIFHHWFQDEGEIITLEGQELKWVSLFDFPRYLDGAVHHAFKDPIFMDHIIKPESEYAL